MGSLADSLAGMRRGPRVTNADLEVLAELATMKDPWDRTSSFHATASALIVHPPTRRVLLRWHKGQRGWIHVGGHADRREGDPLTVALREAKEESGLLDLAPWPNPDRPEVLHAVIVDVAATLKQGAHRHGDIRYAMSTSSPDALVAEDDAALRWLSIEEAVTCTSEENVRYSLGLLETLLDIRSPSTIH